MLDELETAAVVNERVARYARRVVIGLGETAVDHHEFAVCLNGIFAVGGADGHVAVDNVAMQTPHAESIHDAIAHGCVVAQRIIIALVLFVRFLVGDKVAFKRCHL